MDTFSAHFVRSLLRDAVLIKPEYLGSNFREVIQQQLRLRLEGVCSRHGYIMPGSVAVHKVSLGRVEATSLNGDVRFDVQYMANVCNPPVGAHLPARVVNMNKFGVLLQTGLMQTDGAFVPVVEIVVTRQPLNGVGSEVDLDNLSPGDEVRVEIVGKRFELNDEKISVVGRIIAGADGKPVPAAAPTAATMPPHLQAFGRVVRESAFGDAGSDDDDAVLGGVDAEDVDGEADDADGDEEEEEDDGVEDDGLEDDGVDAEEADADEEEDADDDGLLSSDADVASDADDVDVDEEDDGTAYDTGDDASVSTKGGVRRTGKR